MLHLRIEPSILHGVPSLMQGGSLLQFVDLFSKLAASLRRQSATLRQTAVPTEPQKGCGRVPHRLRFTALTDSDAAVRPTRTVRVSYRATYSLYLPSAEGENHPRYPPRTAPALLPPRPAL